MSTPGQNPTTPPGAQDCDILPVLANHLHLWQQRYDALEDLPPAIGLEAEARDREITHLIDRLDSARQLICSLKAKTLSGAAVQSSVLLFLLDMQANSGGESSQPDTRAILRLCHSIADYLVSRVGADERTILDAIKIVRQNPWQPYEEWVREISNRSAV